MKKLLLTFYFAFYIFQNGLCQNPLIKQWDYRFGGVGNEWLHSIKETSDGGFILGGNSQSDSSGDKTQDIWGVGNNPDYWIVKVDSIGTRQWDKDFGGDASEYFYSVQQTIDGGYLLGGFSNSGVSGDKTQSGWGGFDYWIIKTDVLGNKQWDKDFGGTNADRLYSAFQTSDTGYILGGWSSSGISGDKTQDTWGYFDYWIIKTDAAGTKQWDKDFGGSKSDALYSIAQTADRGYILGGSSKSGISGDKSQANWDPTENTNDYWIVKIDTNGAKQWDKRYGGTADDELYFIDQTPDGGYILGGLSKSGISGDKTQATWGVGTDADFWILKIDSLGNKQWDKDFGGVSPEDEFANIYQTNDGGYLIAGNSYSDSTGDKTENNLGTEQSWVLKIDSLGNKQWDKTLLTNCNPNDEDGFAIQTKDGCFVMANETAGGIGGDKTQPAWGGEDYWIIKFCDSTITTGVSYFQLPTSDFTIFPNPATAFINISFPSSEKNISIEMYDLYGREVLKSTIKNQQSAVTINISDFSNGIYAVEIKAGKNTYRKKIIKL